MFESKYSEKSMFVCPSCVKMCASANASVYDSESLSDPRACALVDVTENRMCA